LEKFGVELGFDYIHTKERPDNDKKNLAQYQAHLKYYPFSVGSLTPYVSAGIGGDINAGGGIGPSVAVGTRYKILENFGIFTEARENYLCGDGNDVSVVAGLNFFFGKKSPKVVEVDSDKDGVLDKQDKCPDTPAGVKVDATGCPLDSDKDGVADYLDKCPGTPAGSKVDEVGCEISISLVIVFDTNKAIVKEKFYPEIEKVANFMKSHPDIKIEIAGHTDSVGVRKTNINLSQKRAEAVAKVLTDKYGIAKDRVIAKGYGPDKPVATNKTPEGRAKNRRVEAVIIK